MIPAIWSDLLPSRKIYRVNLKSRMRIMILRLLMLSLILTLGGCKTTPDGAVPEELVSTLRVFEDVVRWGKLEKMYGFYRAEKGVVTVQGGLDNVRVTSYEVVGKPAEISPWRWGQTALVHYVLQDRQVVRSLSDQQLWASDDEGLHWYRVNPPPRF